MDSIITNFGDHIIYSILPEDRTVELVSIETKQAFDKILVEQNAQKITVDYSKLEAIDDSSYTFSLARISLISVYTLSNGLYAIDQLINTKANPYYICKSLNDYKLITKYLLIFRPDIGGIEVQCWVCEHFTIKKFLTDEKNHLQLVVSLSGDRHRVFISNDRKYVYVRYQKGIKNNPMVGILADIAKQNDATWYTAEELMDENEFYQSLVIYESLEKLKLNNIELR